jgi:hypothetical protein
MKFAVGARFMRWVIAFFGFAAALALLAWRQLCVAVTGSPHLSASEMLFVGAVFTLAIAVLIRD